MNGKNQKTSGFGIGEAGSTPASTPLDDLEAIQMTEKPHARMVRCDCGHTVPASLVMRANYGTACPDCYDDMSD